MTNRRDAGADQSVVRRAQSGDESAWQTLFDVYYERLYRFFRSRLPGDTDPDDLASEVFLEAFRSIERFQWQHKESFSAWLFAIARHVLASFYRARSRADITDEIGLNQLHVRDEFVQVEVLDILQRLSADHRAALELRYLVGLNGDEAAAVMGRSHPAFRSLLHRASQAFQRESDRMAAPLEGRLLEDRPARQLTEDRRAAHDRRAFPRIPVSGAVLITVLRVHERWDPDLAAHPAILNLSGGGVLLRVDGPASVGDRLALRLRLGDEDVEVDGSIVRVEHERTTYVRRLGVRFEGVSQSLQRRLVEFVEAERRKHLGQPTR